MWQSTTPGSRVHKRSRSGRRPLVPAVIAVVALLAAVAPSAHAAVPGEALWDKVFDGKPHSDDVGRDVAVSPDGTKVFVTGSGRLYDYVTIAYDAVLGTQIWKRVYTSPDGIGGSSALSLVVSPDGSTVFVTGQVNTSAHGLDYGTVAYDAVTGAQGWASLYNGPGSGDDVAMGIDVSPDGTTVFVTGHSYGGSSTNDDVTTIAYDAADGTESWAKRFSANPDPASEVGYGIAASPGGEKVFVTGNTYPHGDEFNADSLTIAYEAATGTRLWKALFNGPANEADFGVAVAARPTGGQVYATGYSVTGSGTDSVTTTIGYRAKSGAVLWVRKESHAYAYANAASPDGSGVFITGENWDVGAVLTAGYTSDGTRLWAKQYQGTGSQANVGNAVAVAPNSGAVYVSGLSTTAESEYDYVTIAYDALNGMQSWASDYTGPGGISDFDIAHSIAVNPDGSAVFTTGEVFTDATRADIGTVAYQT